MAWAGATLLLLHGGVSVQAKPTWFRVEREGRVRRDGEQVTVRGRVRCTAGETLYVSVELTQRRKGKRPAHGVDYNAVPCTGKEQRWRVAMFRNIVPMDIDRGRFEEGRTFAQVVAVAVGAESRTEWTVERKIMLRVPAEDNDDA